MTTRAPIHEVAPRDASTPARKPGKRPATEDTQPPAPEQLTSEQLARLDPSEFAAVTADYWDRQFGHLPRPRQG